jgi:tight adherence protein B
LLLALLVGLGGLLLGWDLPIASGSAALAGVLLHAALAVLAQRRALRLEEGLAEVIALVSSGLRVGASPLEALERAADAVGGPARSVLLDLGARLRLGEEPEAALEELTRRVPLESFRLFSLALAVQWRAGGSLQRSLATVGRSIRNRVQVARRIHSQSASTRGSVVAFTVATAAVALLMWQYDPGNLERFLRSGSGAALLGGALWLQALAILWMSRLTRVQV